MIFSPKKGSDTQPSDVGNSLFRVVQQLLEAYALHAVEFDSIEHAAFRSSMRGIAERLERAQDHRDYLILAGETNKTIQAYNHLVERFIRDLSLERQSAVELLSRSLLRVCNASDKSAQTLRQLEKELANASQLQEMREVRAKLAECVGTLCLEAEVQEAQNRDLKERISECGTLLEPRDQVTGLSTLKAAEARVEEVAEAGQEGYAITFFLKNVDVVNRRFGFSAGDFVLKQFAMHLAKTLQGKDRLFRWRGPCFVVIANRFTSLDAVQSNAYQVGIRGPEVEVESASGKSMLIRLTAATTAFPIAKGQAISELSAKIDQFAAQQFKIASPPRE